MRKERLAIYLRKGATLRESPNDVAIYPYTYIAVTHL